MAAHQSVNFTSFALVVFEFAKQEYIVEESVGMFQVCLHATGSTLIEDVMFNVTQKDLSTTGEPKSISTADLALKFSAKVDYDLAIEILLFEPGTLVQCFNISIIDDDIDERSEQFSLVATLLTEVSGGVSVQGVPIVTIIDDDDGRYNEIQSSVCLNAACIFT